MNDPVNFIDPTGTIWHLIVAPILGGAVGGVVGGVSSAILGGNLSDIKTGAATGFIGGAVGGLGLATGLGSAAAIGIGFGASALTALPDSGVSTTDIANGLKDIFDSDKSKNPACK